ncbi:MAG: HIT family protein [Campylobacterales bacterium]|nr:HIT family protein [Campylobacterales bacterium]
MIYQNNLIYIEIHQSEIPWLKIFTKRKIKEFSEASLEEKTEIFRLLDLIEKEMINYFNPEKINIAQFGNYLPHLHWHIMARFKEDSYFPEHMWGEKQREGDLNLPSLDLFIRKLLKKLKI